MHTLPNVLLLGASGRVGRLVHKIWPSQAPLTPIWHQGRAAGFDLLRDPQALARLMRKCDLVINVAGVVPGRGADLAANTSIAVAVQESAQRAGVRHVFHFSSQAVYGIGDGPFREDSTPSPVSDYGRAKLAMEQSLAVFENHTSLRIGNVAGADQLLGGLAPGVTPRLDQFADQSTPVRNYIGPQSLAQTLVALGGLAMQDTKLPPVLNVAGNRAVSMGDLLTEAGVSFRHIPAPDTAIAKVVMDMGLFASLVSLPQDADTAKSIVAEWKRAKAAT